MYCQPRLKQPDPAEILVAGTLALGLDSTPIIKSAKSHAERPATQMGLILMVDWLLDRFRTAVNCFGDSVGTAIVDGVMEEDDELLDDDPKPEGATA